jgi:predicted DNA-binding transcriptional regulator YafY
LTEVFRFIEQRLFWAGTIRRADLCARFSVSEPTAARMLRAYRSQFNGQIALRRGGRSGWIAAPGFAPAYYTPRPEDSGLFVEGVAADLFSADEERARAVTWRVAQSLRTQQCLRIQYVDWQGRQTVRDVQPVGWIAIASRVEILYAYCHLRKGYRSFDFAGIQDCRLAETPYTSSLPKVEEAVRVGVTIGDKTFHVPRFTVYPLVSLLFGTQMRDAQMKKAITDAVARLLPAQSV